MNQTWLLTLAMEQDTKQPVLQAMTNFCQALISSTNSSTQTRTTDHPS